MSRLPYGELTYYLIHVWSKPLADNSLTKSDQVKKHSWSTKNKQYKLKLMLKNIPNVLPYSSKRYQKYIHLI